MGNQPLPPGVTQGTVSKLPCPWCGQSNSFSDDSELLEPGNFFNCDHCKRLIELVAIRKVTLLTARRK